MKLSAAARCAVSAVLVLTLASVGAAVSAGHAAGPATSSAADGPAEMAADAVWQWPLAWPLEVASPFVAPPHEFGPGHRGIDLTPLAGDEVFAPADGTVAFAGQVAGRGIVTIDHGGGLVTTLEPVMSALAIGSDVTAGARVGALAVGGHTPPGSLHFGVRLDGEYVNPMMLLGGVPRAVLLPCC